MNNKNRNQTPTQTPSQITTEQVIQAIKDTLKLDAKTMVRIYEAMHDERFTITTEGEEIIMRIGPVECDSEGYADVALTPAETIALAIRLIRYAIEMWGS